MCICSHIFCTGLCSHCLLEVEVKRIQWTVTWYVRWGFEGRVWFKVLICITGALILVGCENLSPFLPSSLLILQTVYWKSLSYFTPEKETQRKTYVFAYLSFVCSFNYVFIDQNYLDTEVLKISLTQTMGREGPFKCCPILQLGQVKGQYLSAGCQFKKLFE